ncbi:cellulase family glycosylhydrolase [Vitiosangium sp. GDMCC 1.1324]|uniref:cellulase family glycosylhydrolase n=1 Tax=Vitiosangium sp. (strain GDMCC 1.1324) TaxID=2138576 RepID=UPI000D3BADCE|nr:cellulase family glycosylhydrolase [Vitiosangium sp. GDMCC 1.1324]PTL81674.1 glycosyl hydrolase [Vitiosangium sp. GDMCC 1.1324]
MRASFLSVLLLSMTACGEDALEVLQEEASDCPEAPAMRLGIAPPAAVVLNAYYLQEDAARDVRRGRTESPSVEETFAKAAALGAWAVRTNGYNDAADKRGDTALQVAPLEYDEVSLRGLDLVLTRAAAYGVKLVLPLGNYWDAYGGARRYVEWAGLPEPVEGDARFFTERAVIEHYKAHISRLLSRVNTFDGLRYGEHPAVLAWELLNEPRGKGLDADGVAMRAWVDEVAAVVKHYAPGHLVGTGEEGFDTSFAGYDELYWRAAVSHSLFEGGTSYRRNTASPLIDFASVHFYPEAYGVEREHTARAGAHWFSEHAAIARDFGKPLFIGEFAVRNREGFTLDERRAMYRGWFRCAWRTGVGSSSPWMFANDARPDEWDDFTFYFRDGTVPADSRNRYADLVIEAASLTGKH